VFHFRQTNFASYEESTVFIINNYSFEKNPLLTLASWYL